MKAKTDVLQVPFQGQELWLQATRIAFKLTLNQHLSLHTHCKVTKSFLNEKQEHVRMKPLKKHLAYTYVHCKVSH